MKKSKWFLSLAVLLISGVLNANNTKGTFNGDTLSGAKASYRMEKIFSTADGCDSSSLQCTYVLIEYPVFESDQMANANGIINHSIAVLLGNGDTESPAMEDLREITADFIREYVDFKKSFPESAQVWYARIMSTVIYNENGLVCVRTASDMYTGGAHENRSIAFYTFDQKTGKVVDPLSSIKNKEAFFALAEKKFREERGLSPDESLSDAGFWFPDNKFKLPENIGITDKGYILYFNAYEQGPYSLGPTRVFIGYDELKDE